MRIGLRPGLCCAASWVLTAWATLTPALAADGIGLTWTNHMLTLHGGPLARPIPILYLEAYCRPGSTDRDWSQTVIPHTTEMIDASADGHHLHLRDRLADGVLVDHEIQGTADSVEFRLVARNPTDRPSAVAWAQPCVRVDAFTGSRHDDFNAEVPEYARKCFVFIDGHLTRLPTRPWATKAHYTPGQVWAGPGVDLDDVNPRPLSALRPSNGLIGCYSADESQVLAMAWEPWQELFQGVIGCIHSDFRIAGLAPGERKVIQGRLYVVGPDLDALLRRYRREFAKP